MASGTLAIITSVVSSAAEAAQGRREGREEDVVGVTGLWLLLPSSCLVERRPLEAENWQSQLLAAPQSSLVGLCFLISTRGIMGHPCSQAVWEGQAEHQGPWAAGSPVLRLVLTGLGFCPQHQGPGGRKEDRRG